MSKLALYAGGFGVPLVYVSGDEALCAEAARLFPNALSTPTKRETGWDTCEFYAPDTVRDHISWDFARALHRVDPATTWAVAFSPCRFDRVRLEWSSRSYCGYCGG